jgi:hypothetical protein
VAWFPSVPAASAVIVSLASLAAGRRDVQLFPAPGEPTAIRVGRIDPVGNGAQLMVGGKWRDLEPGAPLFTGQAVRTGQNGAVGIDLAWSMLVLGPSSSFRLQPSHVLTATLDNGRVEQRAGNGDIIRFRTAEASITGRGDVVIRRDNGVTAVSALAGEFRVENELGSAVVTKGHGTVVEAGAAPSAPVPLPAPVSDLIPGRDPRYVKRGLSVPLRWTSASTRGHVQLVAEPSGELAADVDVDDVTYSVAPALGLYRWRVSATNDAGLESLPSADGLICVVEQYD